jgi:hypothetical protein
VVNVLRRNRRIDRGYQPPHRLHCRGVRIDGADLEAVLQEKRKVAPGSAARVEDAAATVEPAAKQLIEQVNVDLPELRP